MCTHDYECSDWMYLRMPAKNSSAELAGVEEPEKKCTRLSAKVLLTYSMKKLIKLKIEMAGTRYHLSWLYRVIKYHRHCNQKSSQRRWTARYNEFETMRASASAIQGWSTPRRSWTSGMPEHLITRHPFPGPGLAVRILGDITPEKKYVFCKTPMISISKDFRETRKWKDSSETKHPFTTKVSRQA